LYGRNPKGWGFDRREFVSLDQARAACKAIAKDASNKAFLAAVQPAKQVHTFKGFTLELERDGDTLYADISHGDFAGSLAFAEHNGYIDDGEDGKRKRVPQEVIEKFWELEANYPA
jgi:hypothetical protein